MQASEFKIKIKIKNGPRNRMPRKLRK